MGKLMVVEMVVALTVAIGAHAEMAAKTAAEPRTVLSLPAGKGSPLSPASIIRRKSGDLICFWNDHEGRADLQKAGAEWACGVRTPLTVGISADEGLTWRRRNLETEYDAKNSYHYWYCYTAVLELDDRILAAYCAENNLKNLRIKSIPLAWLP